ncbi:MAG: hypothetical protein M3083_19030, partial [Actinomycetota bacterium]|nr:hypothetical protein [Actinomycetota bacterium]
MTDAAVTTGLVTVVVGHVGLAPHPGVLTLVKLAVFEMVEPLASPASTVTWKLNEPAAPGATDDNVHVTVPPDTPTLQPGTDAHVAELATYVVPAGMLSVTVTGPEAVPPLLA